MINQKNTNLKPDARRARSAMPMAPDGYPFMIGLALAVTGKTILARKKI